MFCYLNNVARHVSLEPVSLQYKHYFNKIVIHMHIQLVSVLKYGHVFKSGYLREYSTPVSVLIPDIAIGVGAPLLLVM